MAGDEDLYVFACEGKHGARLAAFLEEHAVRVQPGLFEAVLPADSATRTIARLRELVEPGERLRVYSIPLSHIERIESVGGAPPPESGRFWIL